MFLSWKIVFSFSRLRVLLWREFRLWSLALC